MGTGMAQCIWWLGGYLGREGNEGLKMRDPPASAEGAGIACPENRNRCAGRQRRHDSSLPRRAAARAGSTPEGLRPRSVAHACERWSVRIRRGLIHCTWGQCPVDTATQLLRQLSDERLLHQGKVSTRYPADVYASVGQLLPSERRG